MATTEQPDVKPVQGQWDEYPLIDALLNRRSRRFGKGFHLNGGPLAFRSDQSPQPLTLEEEAILAFAAAGVTGYALLDLPFQSGDSPEASGGNMLVHLIGRTAPSPDSIHSVIVFVINDEGAWMLRRPQDVPRSEIPGLIDAARRRDLVELYERSRVKIADSRVDIPRKFPYQLPLNKWSANVPGSTYFLPVAECSGLAINALLVAFDDEWSAFLLDERNGYRPAGLGRFAKSKGGHLRNDPRDERVLPSGMIETTVYEMIAVETGAIIQNLGLMSQALGLGGFPHYAGHPYGWFQALGFQMQDIPTSRIAALGPLMRLALRAMKQDLPIPTAVGLERQGEPLLKSWSPPWYRDMDDAVRAFVDYKFGAGTGTFRDGGATSAWKDPATVQLGIPAPSEHAIAATVSYCTYIYERYGRFPAGNGPFRTSVAYQAHHIDRAFYDRFYTEDALSKTKHEHS